MITATAWREGSAYTEIPPDARDALLDRIGYWCAVAKLLKERGGNRYSFGSLNIMPIAEEMAGSLRDGLGDNWQHVNKQGKLAKRIAKILKKTHGIDPIPNEALDSIAATIESSSVPPHYYSITDQLNWNAGDYRDNGSCFWNERKHDRASLVANGGLAYLVRSRLENGAMGHGVARCWLVPSTNRVFAFNAYGFMLETMVHSLLADIDQPLNYKRIEFAMGNIYINSSSAYVMSEAKLKEDEERSLKATAACRCTSRSATNVCHNCPFGRKSEA